MMASSKLWVKTKIIKNARTVNPWIIKLNSNLLMFNINTATSNIISRTSKIKAIKSNKIKIKNKFRM